MFDQQGCEEQNDCYDLLGDHYGAKKNNDLLKPYGMQDFKVRIICIGLTNGGRWIWLRKLIFYNF